jgi:lipopolysaccharide transport system permease protein
LLIMPELILEPGRTEKNDWRSRWRYRELFYFLAWRDILVRNKQTVIGIAWAVLRPFRTMVVFTVLFHRIANMQASGALPYALFVCAACYPGAHEAWGC